MFKRRKREFLIYTMSGYIGTRENLVAHRRFESPNVLMFEGGVQNWVYVTSPARVSVAGELRDGAFARRLRRQQGVTHHERTAAGTTAPALNILGVAGV